MTVRRIGPDDDSYAREQQLRIRAGQVMAEIRANGGDWQEQWRNHPVAKEYRALLREVWGGETTK